MTVGIVGSGPAATAVEAALADVDSGTERCEADDVVGFELGVVVDQAGSAVFERANDRALESGLEWLALELGGVGGVPVVDAAVAGFAPDTGCYACLAGRVEANLEPDAEPTGPPPAHTARFAGAVAGREAVRALGSTALDSNGGIFGRVVEVPYTEREFLPLPNCTCDGGRDRRIPREYVTRSVEESLARAERALDDHVGVVTEVGEAESFPVPYYLARACETGGFSDASAARDAAGVAPDWDSAFMKALGEAMERYCAGVYRADDFVTGTPAELEGTVGPGAFVCRSEPDGGEIPWVHGEDLATGEGALLPAEFVHFPPPSRRHRPALTTGLGLGNSGVEALLSGLYEVVERDAAMLSWYSTFEPLGLALEDDAFGTMVARARSEELSVTPLLLTQDVDVPVVAVAVRREEWPRFALGSAANLDVTRAARSALAEALQNWMELRGMGPEGADDAMGAIGRYADLPETAAALVDADTMVPAESVGPEDPPSGEDELTAVVERLSAAGLDAYAARTTTRDVEAVGFEAVRVLVPVAQPLCFGDVFFGERAESVPGSLGFSPRLERDHHPFP